jgi:hypothetical protein
MRRHVRARNEPRAMRDLRVSVFGG